MSTEAWSAFTDGSPMVGTDILVGLRSGANRRFDASALLFVANNLSDVFDKIISFNNISPLSDTGDTLYFDGTNNVALAIGTAGQIYVVNGSSLPAWEDNPGLLIASNLSDLADVATALTNLGLGSANNVSFNEVAATVSQTAPSFISTALNNDSHVNALTAHAGGGQSSALQLSKTINRVTTVATSGDSVKLPSAVAGTSVAVINAAASNPMNCYPTSGDAINALAANTALSILANKTVLFFCAVNGTWNTIVTA